MESRPDDGYRPRDPESAARAVAFAKNTRLKFERVYRSARRALDAGDLHTALVKCRAGRDLLNEKNIYGAQQAEIARQLEEQIQRLTEQLGK